MSENASTFEMKPQVIREYLNPIEKGKVREYYDKIRVESKKITFGEHEISINVQKGMEHDIKLLLSQMIIRGINHHTQDDFGKSLRRRTSNQPLDIYGKAEIYKPGTSGDIDANIGIIFNTTTVSNKTLRQLFSYSKGKGSMEIEAEDLVVAQLLSNMINTIINEEIGIKEK